MEFQHIWGGFQLDRTDPHGRAPISSWLSTGSLPLFLIHTGNNSAGSGGNGYVTGSLLDSSNVAFEPLNVAEGQANATADAYQANIGYFDQAAIQVTGVGGDGGNQNIAMGGSVGGRGSSGTETIGTGDNSAGNGGDGHFSGAMLHAAAAVYNPINMAVASSHASADAQQSNVLHIDQSATQIAGVGGHGGSGNAAIGGDVSVSGAGHGPGQGFGHELQHGGIGSDVIATGGNSAGNGGDGYFSGSLVHESFALYEPINIAVAGANSSAYAGQTNNVDFNQATFQLAGVGGHGGSGNAAMGGDASVSGFGHGFEHVGIGSSVIATGGNSAGNGGDGSFSGSLVHESFALYDPINIAVAGANSSAAADQTNNVDFNQAAFQLAGVGGQGGNGNAALGGHAGGLLDFGLIGSDVIATGGNSAGDGGSGHFSGTLVDVNVAIYAPINIAVAGYNSTATANQSNNVHFDQSAIQIAGVGGDGGHGNIALGGDFALHLLADHHLLDHIT